MELLGHLPSIC